MEQYEKLKRAFLKRRKPTHFMNFNHCKECELYDSILLSNDNDSISFSLVGNMCTSPISSSSIEGILYYLPGLSRLSAGEGSEYFLDQLLVYVDDERFLTQLLPVEASAFKAYLEWLNLTKRSEIEKNGDDLELVDLINKLQSICD
jgi:hypothetical protein